VYVPSGHLVFFRDGALLALPFNVERLAATGPAVRVVDNIATDVNGIPLAAMSNAGMLAYAPGETGTSRLVWVSRQGLEQSITDAPKHYQSPRLAPDGRRVVLQIGGDLWINDLARTTSTRLTSSDTVGTSFPVWSADGTRVVFRSRIGMRWIDVEGGGGGHAIPGSTGIEDFPNSLSPDGDTLAFLRQSVDTSGDIYVASLHGSSPPRVVVGTPVYEGGAQFSPDGRWLAYASNESGQLQVYVRPFPGPDRRAAVSTQGGSFPLWRRDGKELFYRTGNRMMGVDVSTGGGNVTLSQPHVLFDQRYLFETLTIANYDVSLDGQRFLMVKDESGSGRLNVVLNWLDELKRLAPTK
jgi:Tol biopolymer transport system component